MRPTALITATAVAVLVGACGNEEVNTAARAETARATSTTPTAGAQGRACFDTGRKLSSNPKLYIEYNATDEDTGLHGVLGHEGLAVACLEKPDGTPILRVDPRHKLDELGINEFFFESREPPRAKYSRADLRADFPEGRYRISGIDFKGKRRVGTALLTHAIPAPPEIVAPTVVAEEEAAQNTLAPARLTVRWRPVTQTIDDEPVDIAAYEVIVTQDKFDNPNAIAQPEFDVHVPPDVTELRVPDGFLQPGTLYELEVLAIEDSGNQTISLGFFTTR